MKRRDAIRYTGYAAAMFGLSPDVNASAPPMPDRSLLASEPERYWARIRSEQFLLPDWRAFLNNGSLGVAPKPVVMAVSDSLSRGASLTTDDYPRWGYETMDDYRSELAKFIGCTKDELALTHNATEAMNFVSAGLDLKPGDEVLLTDQEHPSGRYPWLLKQARFGVAVREVNIPLPPKSSGQLAETVVSAFGPHTRVISFSGITTSTGLVLPIREICSAARAKGIISVVDGAHMAGQIPFRIADFGCDFLVGSPHKWLFTPPGCGFLYIREDMLDRVWPTVVTGGWDEKPLKAARFMRVGTNNRAILDGLLAGMRFHQELGSEVVFSRIHHLARSAYAKAAARPYFELLTPEDDRLYGAMVSFRLRKGGVQPLLAACRKRRIWVLQGERLRISTHVHTRPSDIDSFFAVADEVCSGV